VQIGGYFKGVNVFSHNLNKTKKKMERKNQKTLLEVASNSSP
jgi:hypothetical protein